MQIDFDEIKRQKEHREAVLADWLRYPFRGQTVRWDPAGGPIYKTLPIEGIPNIGVVITEPYSLRHPYEESFPHRYFIETPDFRTVFKTRESYKKGTKEGGYHLKYREDVDNFIEYEVSPVIFKLVGDSLWERIK